jgi:hypothetical protein
MNDETVKWSVLWDWDGKSSISLQLNEILQIAMSYQSTRSHHTLANTGNDKTEFCKTYTPCMDSDFWQKSSWNSQCQSGKARANDKEYNPWSSSQGLRPYVNPWNSNSQPEQFESSLSSFFFHNVQWPPWWQRFWLDVARCRWEQAQSWARMDLWEQFETKTQQ